MKSCARTRCVVVGQQQTKSRTSSTASSGSLGSSPSQSSQSTLGWLLSSALALPAAVVHSLSHTDNAADGVMPVTGSVAASSGHTPKKGLYAACDLDL
jgi:hypothetical protein